MNEFLTILAPLSSWLVMLHLGAQTINHSLPHKQKISYPFVLSQYLIPLSLIFLFSYLGFLSVNESFGLTVCILSGIGTSAVPWALRDGASASAVTHRLALCSTFALVTLPLALFFYFNTEQTQYQVIFMFCILIGTLWTPWYLGKLLAKHSYLTANTLNLLGKLATFSVIALILIIACKELPKLPDHPWLVFVCLIIVTAQVISGAITEASTGLATTTLIKNLTLATLVIIINKQTLDSLTSVAAFGAIMYLGVYPTLALSKRIRNRETLA